MVAHPRRLTIRCDNTVATDHHHGISTTKSNIITRLIIIVTATISQPLLPVLLLDLHIYPVSVFCFLASMSTGGRLHAMLQLRGRERVRRRHIPHAQAMLACYFLATGNKILTERWRFSGFATRKWEVCSAGFCYLGISRAGSGSRRKKSGSRIEGFEHSAWSECGETLWAGTTGNDQI
jgi:hypothetical protein